MGIYSVMIQKVVRRGHASPRWTWQCGKRSHPWRLSFLLCRWSSATSCAFFLSTSSSCLDFQRVRLLCEWKDPLDKTSVTLSKRFRARKYSKKKKQTKNTTTLHVSFMCQVCRRGTSRSKVAIKLSRTCRLCNLLLVSCHSGGHAAHRASFEKPHQNSGEGAYLRSSRQQRAVYKTHLQEHLLHHNGALQVHHRHGRHGVHRGLPVQGGLLLAPHQLHRPHLHPAAQHAHRPHEPHSGEDRPGEQQHLAATGEAILEGPEGVLSVRGGCGLMKHLWLFPEGYHHPGHGEKAAVLSEEGVSLWGGEEAGHRSWGWPSPVFQVRFFSVQWRYNQSEMLWSIHHKLRVKTHILPKQVSLPHHRYDIHHLYLDWSILSYMTFHLSAIIRLKRVFWTQRPAALKNVPLDFLGNSKCRQRSNERVGGIL